MVMVGNHVGGSWGALWGICVRGWCQQIGQKWQNASFFCYKKMQHVTAICDGVLALVMVWRVGMAFPNHKLAWFKVWDHKMAIVP